MTTGGTIVCDVTDPLAGRPAADLANALAARLGLRVVLASVAHGEAAAAGSLAAVADELGVEVERRVAVGDRAEALARVAAEEGADLIIVGSRAVGFGGRNLRCAFVDDLDSATPVPVLVAPPSRRKRSERRLGLAAHAPAR
jgi:nucleotide-binding universal stress UspA family protein